MRIQWRSASFWPSGWTDDQVREYYAKPTEFIDSHRTLNGSDTTPPTGAITAPAEGATIASSTVRLSGTASDGGSGLAKAHFLVTYNGIQNQIGPDFTTSPFNYYWDMCAYAVPNGQQISLTIEAWDKAGNKATAAGRHQALLQELQLRVIH